MKPLDAEATIKNGLDLYASETGSENSLKLSVARRFKR
jgi:hypothetical protein